MTDEVSFVNCSCVQCWIVYEFVRTYPFGIIGF
jgi:hypothetical protein